MPFDSGRAIVRALLLAFLPLLGAGEINAQVETARVGLDGMT